MTWVKLDYLVHVKPWEKEYGSVDYLPHVDSLWCVLSQVMGTDYMQGYLCTHPELKPDESLRLGGFRVRCFEQMPLDKMILLRYDCQLHAILNVQVGLHQYI